MATHDFSKSLNYEHSNFPKADKFYTEKLKAGSITRIGFEDEESKALQRLDVDVSFVYKGKKINVSEKDRTADYGDLLLEFYSKFPHTPGWMNNSAADYLAYFVPNKVYWIDKKQLSLFYHNTLADVIPDSFFQQLINNYPRQSRREQKIIELNGTREAVTVVQAFNAPRNSSSFWYTENICVKFTTLKKAGVQIEEFFI